MFYLCTQKAGAMCKKSGVLNSSSVPTYRTRTFAKKAYRTNVPYPYHYKKSIPYFLAKIEAYRTVPYCHPWSTMRLNARILRWNFLSDFANGAEAPSLGLHHWLRPQNRKCALKIKSAGLWKKMFSRFALCQNLRQNTGNDFAGLHVHKDIRKHVTHP